MSARDKVIEALEIAKELIDVLGDTAHSVIKIGGAEEQIHILNEAEFAAANEVLEAIKVLMDEADEEILELEKKAENLELDFSKLK